MDVTNDGGGVVAGTDPAQPTCSNCGAIRDVAWYSFDVDLPKLRLCRLCSFVIGHDQELFDHLGRKRR